MKRLDTICKDYLNIADDVNFFEIIKFCKKYDGYPGDVFFLINFDGERRLIDENDIESKNRDNYKVLGFTPRPALSSHPDYCLLFCKVLDSKNNWEYLKIKTNKKTTKELWEKKRVPLTVLVYKSG